MKQLSFFAVVTFAIAILSNCKSAGTISQGEAVERVSTFWGTKNNIDTSYTMLHEKVWYRDSVGITQVCGMFTEETDSTSVTTIRTLRYRFVDLRKMWIYEYSTFTDTAPITRKFRYTDSARYSGGWNFSNRTPLPVDDFQLIGDTVITGITYKRSKISYIFNNARFDGLGLSRCDKKGTYFQIDTAISNKVGCALVNLRFYTRSSPNSGLDLKVNFISANFPDSVRKVFDAWILNEKRYPVQ